MTESRPAGFICMSLSIGKSWKPRQSCGMASFACVFVLLHTHSQFYSGCCSIPSDIYFTWYDSVVPKVNNYQSKDIGCVIVVFADSTEGDSSMSDSCGLPESGRACDVTI